MLHVGLDIHSTRITICAPDEHGQVVRRARVRTAVHSGSGLLTLRQLVLHAVRHLRHHLPFIAENRAALGGATP